jgi:outer membrane protein assembly factor BamB
MRTLTFILLAAAMAAFGQNTDEWPIQHNVHQTGHSSTTVLKPPLKMRWATKIQGNFQGQGPVVAEGKVVTQSDGGNLTCLDAETGELLWRYFIEGTGNARSAPCIWNGRVYANFHSKGWPDIGGMRCFDLTTGEQLWKNGSGGYSIPRNHYSPQVTNGKLFFACIRDNNMSLYTEGNYDWQAQVLAWDALTGDSLWTYTLIPGITSSPNTSCNTSILAVGDTVYASASYNAGGGKTAAFDLAGNVLWSSSTHYISSYVGQLQYLPGKLIIMMKNNPTPVRILSTSDWSVLLSGGGGNDYSKINAVMNGRYYNRSYAAPARAYDLATGQQVATMRTYGSEGFHSGCSPIVTCNGYIYQGFGSASDALLNNGQKWYAFNEAGDPIWSYQTSNNACNPIAIAYDRLYTLDGGDAMVYCWESE